MQRCRHTPVDIIASGPYRHILGLHRGRRPPLKGQQSQNCHVLKWGATAGLCSAAYGVKPYICGTGLLFAVADAGKASPFHSEKVFNATNTVPVTWPQTPQIRKPQTQLIHQHCSQGSANKWNPCPALIWSIHMPLLQGGPFNTVFRREEQTHKSFQSHQGKTWQELDHKNSTKCPISSCQYLHSCNQFSLFFASPTLPPRHFLPNSPFAKDLANWFIVRF